MLLSVLLKENKRILCQVGAGKGKSRIAAAVAAHFLRTTNKLVYMVFSDNGLLKRDMNQC